MDTEVPAYLVEFLRMAKRNNLRRELLRESDWELLKRQQKLEMVKDAV